MNSGNVNWDQTWSLTQTIKGAYGKGQCHTLFQVAQSKSLIVEIGSHLGRSTSVLLSTGAHVVSIDPHYDEVIYSGFIANMQKHPNWNNLEIIPQFDREAIVGWHRPIDFLHLDADCIYLENKLQVLEILNRWKPFVNQILVHHYHRPQTYAACLEAGLCLREVDVFMALGMFFQVF